MTGFIKLKFVRPGVATLLALLPTCSLLGINSANATPKYSILHTFDANSTTIPDEGLNPLFGDLIIGRDGNLHGITSSSSASASQSIVYTIGLDGNGYVANTDINGVAYHSLLRDPAGDYLTTTYTGGANGKGAIWQITGSGVQSDIIDFNGTNGSSPDSGLVRAKDGNYYGDTEAGGANGFGVIYRVDGTNLTGSVVHSFTGADGAVALGTILRAADGNLYGICFSGGAHGQGDIWKLTPAGDVIPIYSFSGADGANPKGGLIQGFDGKLYGTTRNGGANSLGAIFSVKTDGTGFKLLHSFSGSTDGQYPTGPLLQCSTGLIYGTDRFGAVNNGGVLFSIATDGSKFTVVHSFGGNGVDGSNPSAGVIEGPDGDLYGTTCFGGIAPTQAVNAQGTIYKYTVKLPVINSFSPSSGTAQTSITIVGANLTYANAISFGGVAGTIVSHTPTQVIARVPVGAKTGRILLTVGLTSTYSYGNFVAN